MKDAVKEGLKAVHCRSLAEQAAKHVWSMWQHVSFDGRSLVVLAYGGFAAWMHAKRVQIREARKCNTDAEAQLTLFIYVAELYAVLALFGSSLSDEPSKALHILHNEAQRCVDALTHEYAEYAEAFVASAKKWVEHQE